MSPSLHLHLGVLDHDQRAFFIMANHALHLHLAKERLCVFVPFLDLLELAHLLLHPGQFCLVLLKVSCLLLHLDLFLFLPLLVILDLLLGSLPLAADLQ